MKPPTPPDVREFDVDTRFQKMARRPGGLPREQALHNAANNIEEIKPHFTGWLDTEIGALLRAIPGAAAARRADLSWLDALDHASIRLIDVAGTMDHSLVELIARHLHAICEAVRAGAPYHDDVMVCHLDALRLCRQPRYRNATLADVPELSMDLRRALLLKYPPSA